MDIFRYTRNAWGLEALEGVSWDLIPLFAGVGLLLIVVHLVYKRVTDSRR